MNASEEQMTSKANIGDCIIAGIGADDNALGQMLAITSNLDAAGYAIAPKDLLNGLRLCFKNRDRRQVEEALYQQLCAFQAAWDEAKARTHQ